MSGIVTFILARIAEVEQAARTRDRNWPIHMSGCYYYENTLDVSWYCDCDAGGAATAHLLAECAAKLQIIRIHASAPATYPDDDPFDYGCCVCHFDDNIQNGDGPCETVLTLARIWSDNPDFDAAWATS